MSPEPTNAEKIRKLPWGLSGDATATIYMYLAFAGSPFLLFMERLGLTDPQIGVLLSSLSFGAIIGLITVPIAGRLGFRRVFLTFWTLRTFMLAALIVSPWLLRYSPGTTFPFVATVFMVFAMCKSIAETSYAPWSQDIIPASVRGKYTAASSIITSAVGALTLVGIGLVLGPKAPLSRFQILFGVAVLFSALSIYSYGKLPGGGPGASRGEGTSFLGDLLIPARDRQFRRFLAGAGLINLGWGCMTTFLPLFWLNVVGLPANQVVFLDSVSLIAYVSAGFFWGWAADRYGGKPVMVLNLALMLIYPIGLICLPLHKTYSDTVAVCLVFVIGLVASGWSIGYYRYFFVNLVPPVHKGAYNAIHGAWSGLTAGVCPIIAGWALQYTKGFAGTKLGILAWTPYTPFFLGCLVLGGLAVIMMARVAAPGGLPVVKFAAMFVQGNPVAAISAVINYQMVGHEEKRISMVERLGYTKSPLSMEELIEALHDPSFNVRYEAIISIARTRPDPRLTEAMIGVLRTADPELRIAAAWALGRMGDPHVAPALREALSSPYTLLRARAARALGTLGDAAAAPTLLELFKTETDVNIRLAYAAALAALGRADVLPEMLTFLRSLEDPAARRELSLAVATFLGRNDQALRIWRRMHDQPGDTLGGIMIGLRRRLTHAQTPQSDGVALVGAIDRCVRALGAGDMGAGAVELRSIGACVRPEAFTPPAAIVLQDALAALGELGAPRVEYVLLAVHALHVGLRPENTLAALAAVAGNPGA